MYYFYGILIIKYLVILWTIVVSIVTSRLFCYTDLCLTISIHEIVHAKEEMGYAERFAGDFH